MPRHSLAARILAGAALIGAALLPAMPGGAAAAPSADGTHRPVPLPAHSQRPVCGPQAAGVARCHAHVVTHPDSAAPLATTSYQSGYRPADLASAYALPSLSGTPGSGPTVAIVDAYDNPNAEADLGAYRAQFGLGACTTANGCFAKVDQRGGTAYPAGDTGWGAEIDLDIQMVSAACPTCRILLVEADSNGFADLMTGVRYAAAHASFVSNSYGGREFSGETSYDSNFAAAGVGFTVSSGDNGYGVEYPAASRNVTAVGGTSLRAATSARGWSESAWSGAGSGCSSYESKPSWQHDSGCSRRTVADVSAVADPNTGVAVYDSYGSSGGANWFVYGGTSVAAPFVAGAWALAGPVGSGTTAAGVPYANPGGWYDVTSGSNTRHCNAGYLCQAVTGYDGPTGLGTPDGTAGFAGSGGGGGGGGGGNAAPTAAFTWGCADLTCSFTDTSSDSDGSIAAWSWSFGDGSTSSLQNPSHGYSGSGSFPVTLTVTDNLGATATVAHTVTVSAPAGSIALSATGYKVKGRDTVDLSWSGASGGVTVYRDGTAVGTASGTTYTDSTGQRGSATYTYRVCETGTTTCSNLATVVF